MAICTPFSGSSRLSWQNKKPFAKLEKNEIVLFYSHSIMDELFLLMETI